MTAAAAVVVGGASGIGAALAAAHRSRGDEVVVWDLAVDGDGGAGADVAEVVLALHGMRWVTGQIVASDGGLSRHSPIDPLGPQPPPT